MSKQEYDNQVITEYLLGSLPEAEAEYFDELSFTDNEFADALKSAEKDLVDSYVQGELVGATLKKFKSFYLASPIRRQKVEFASVFQVIAEKNIAQTNEAIPIVAKTKQTKTIADFFSALNIFGSSRPVLKWSFAAATLAFVFLAGWLWVASTRLDQQQANETIVKQHDLPTEREQDKQIQPKIPRATDKEKELAQGSEERERREQALKKDQAIKQQRIAEQLRRSKQQQQSSPPTIASFILLPPMRDSNSIPNLAIP
ncbi:MAG: hypothetical protein ABI954_00495, partial [Pyrinomonadaceae bacterium]